MKELTRVVAAVAIVAAMGCYHATIDTGRNPSPRVIEKPFAASWVYGLVPPSTVETASQCPNGIARVETQLSFVNQLVGFLTLGIFTPMDIRVTCAAGEEDTDAAELETSTDAGAEQVQRTFERAAEEAARTGDAVLVRFRTP